MQACSIFYISKNNLGLIFFSTPFDIIYFTKLETEFAIFYEKEKKIDSSI